MSKTIDQQIEKSNTLVNALKHSFSEVSSKGVKMNDLDELVNQLEKLQASSKQTDELRAKLTAQVQTTSNILARVKEQYKEIKDIIRVNYPQEKWANYGVLDKR